MPGLLGPKHVQHVTRRYHFCEQLSMLRPEPVGSFHGARSLVGSYKAINVGELTASDHGVPQKRWRMFLVAIQLDSLASSIDDALPCRLPFKVRTPMVS